jgi:hypothetical protein
MSFGDSYGARPVDHGVRALLVLARQAKAEKLRLDMAADKEKGNEEELEDRLEELRAAKKKEEQVRCTAQHI